MRRQFQLLITSVLLILSLTTGCVMQQGLSLTEDQSGWATVDLSVYDFFSTILEDFAPFDEDMADTSVIEQSVDDFVVQLDNAPSTSEASAMKIKDNSYFIDFTFSSLNGILNDLANQNQQTLLTVKESKNSTRLEFYLDLDNYPQLTEIVPFLADENFETFGPLYNQGMNEADYLEMISYILGEEGPDAIRESVISLRLTAPDPIESYEGGILEDDTTIRFDIPLIDILLLAEPITFYAQW
ncbi:MAG: hypothetical protein PQJ47_06340 [Sphaerochaetaceae bacterium]|nr:hypothetical protein [Sphaerochaetaceae bacterium]